MVGTKQQDDGLRILHRPGGDTEFFIRVRCARACGARKVFFLSLPSAYPFSAQARLGPHFVSPSGSVWVKTDLPALWSRLMAIHCRSDSVVVCHGHSCALIGVSRFEKIKR